MLRLGMVAVALAALSISLLLPVTSAQSAGVGERSAPTVTFALDFPQSNPAHYSITVDAAGHGRYECIGKVAEDSEDDQYRSEFEMSAGNRTRVFEWAKQAHYFSGNIDSGNRKIAFTGDKVLSYQDGQRSTEGRYRYSNLEPVRQLTALFQSMAGTLEYGRRLAYYHRYQKLALDEELKQMEEQAKTGGLSELLAIAPVLQEIVEDNSVINVVRVRARELIQMGNATANR
jgi:hypothetical protein